MVIETEELIAAIRVVKETILAAAVLTFKDLNATIESETVAIAEAEAEVEASSTTSETEEPPPDASTEDLERLSSVDKGKAKETPEQPAKTTERTNKSIEYQIQILKWKIEAMADALREDLEDFSMPQGAF